ncbi:transcriptional regulator [bacterium]|nr:transcriptional regulator [bacterium]
MLEVLLSSKVRTKLLTLFLTNPESTFYTREIAGKLSVSLGNLQRELVNLRDIGLLESSKEANSCYYRVNKKFPIYRELKSIIFKTAAIGDVLQRHLTKLGDLKCAFIYGSVAKGEEKGYSDIDLALIGKIDMDVLSNVISKAEKELCREINYTVFGPEEWGKKKMAKDAFVNDLIKNKKIVLLGDLNE